jgi:tetratricopeptide (TPR) repeat protein
VLQGLDIQALEAFGWAVALFLSTLAVVFLIRAAWKRGLGGFFSFLPSALAALDGFLVNRVTFLFGTRWNKFRHAGLVRWSHLTILLFGLALTTALAPLPVAYAAAALGLIGVIAIFRQWSWDEEDRSAGVPGSERRIRVDNDLTNEGLFASAALFLLIPPLLYRLQTGGTPLLVSPEAYGMAGYTAFVLEQFQQALPLLSNFEVYGNAPVLGVESVSGAGRLVALGLRLTFELVLIAGLLLSIEVSRQIASGRDLREQIASLIDADEDRNRAAVDHLLKLARRGRTAARDLLLQCTVGEVDEGKPTKTSQLAAAIGLVRLAELRPDYGMVLLTVAIEGYRRLRAEASDDPLFRADVSVQLGNAIFALGTREGGEAGKARLEEAVSVYRATLEFFTRQAMPEDWAGTQNNLGNAILGLAEREGGEAGKARLEEAVSAFRAVLEVYTRDAKPSKWAGTQNNLGNALQVLGQPEGGEAVKARLEEAISAYRAALEVRTREAMPSDWATTQNNLGDALRVLGQSEGGEAGKARLEEAVSVFRAALEVRKREAMPQQWAVTQNNLGDALRVLGQSEGGEAGKARLEEAISVFRAALEVRTREAMPQQWAVTQNNLEIALKMLREWPSTEG